MNEAEMMQRNGQLFTEKQYKKCFRIIIFSLVFSGIITIAGLIIAMATNNANIVITGVVIGIVGFVLLMISLVIVFKYAGKIQLYRHYKKHPEDFENETSDETVKN